jgi:hypothetical protein
MSMMIIDPDKKATKRGWFRTLFSPFSGANARRARLAHRDFSCARDNLRQQRALSGDVKALRKAGVLK